MTGFLFLGGAGPVASSLDIATAALTQARARGIRSHLTNTEANLAATARVAALADAVSAVDPEDAAESARWVRERGERFDVVLGLRDTVVVAAAEAAAAVGAPGNPPDAVRLVRNKDECRAALAAAGFRQPAVRLCTSVAEAAAFTAGSAGPWVVKPRDAMASIGVRKVRSAAELPGAVRQLPDPGLFLVEEFVPGPEFSVEGVFLGGKPEVLAITAKETLPPPCFVEVGHVLPAELPAVTRREIERQVTAALTALGLRFGIFHVELWLTGDGVVLGEVHGRPGGDWLHLLLAHAIPGLELFGLVFDDVLGRGTGPVPAPSRAAAARFLAPPPGRLIEVHGWDAVTAHPGVLYAELTVAPGAVTGPVRQSTDRAGVVVAGADTPARARALAAELASSVEFVVDPAPSDQSTVDRRPVK
ncbi:ATP-grasp domain-containing protein [Amycolatopsis sp. NPDC049688]|uniref:ATP-grasp domain-containing protein n=1 Tax=Amycolatopsis sp. NPDC049688 TaxID=3154733 RepID=UPI0034157F7D